MILIQGVVFILCSQNISFVANIATFFLMHSDSSHDLTSLLLLVSQLGPKAWTLIKKIHSVAVAFFFSSVSTLLDLHVQIVTVRTGVGDP